VSDESSFDFEGVFDEDYLYFYETMLTDERSDRETDFIVSMLGLKPGAQVLDVPCGHGRISNRLAARGFRVTGLDATELFLDAARKDAPAGVEYVHGDIRKLEWTGRFDAVLNWFTSFGYFDDDTNRSVLRGFRAALKPGGVALLELQNRDRLLTLLPSAPGMAHLFERGDDLMLDKNTLDLSTSRIAAERIIVRNGRVRRTLFTVRTFTAAELSDWLIAAGFAEVQVFGAEGEPFSRESTRLVVVARA